MPQPKTSLWAGRILSFLSILFLLMDGVMKLVRPAPVVEAMAQLGYSDSLATPIGIILIGCVLLYAIPRTAFFGAIFLTGYLGGAIASHVRIGAPLFSHTLFPLYIALMIWMGLLLRSAPLRQFLRHRP